MRGGRGSGFWSPVFLQGAQVSAPYLGIGEGGGMGSPGSDSLDPTTILLLLHLDCSQEAGLQHQSTIRPLAASLDLLFNLLVHYYAWDNMRIKHFNGLYQWYFQSSQDWYRHHLFSNHCHNNHNPPRSAKRSVPLLNGWRDSTTFWKQIILYCSIKVNAGHNQKDIRLIGSGSRPNSLGPAHLRRDDSLSLLIRQTLEGFWNFLARLRLSIETIPSLWNFEEKQIC